MGGGVVKLTAEEAGVDERDFVGVMRRTSMNGTVYETSHTQSRHYQGNPHEEKVAKWNRQAHSGGSRGHGEHDKLYKIGLGTSASANKVTRPALTDSRFQPRRKKK